MAIDQAIIDQLKTANPSSDLIQLGAGGFEIIAISPGQKEMDLWNTLVSDEKTRKNAAARLVHACVVHPDKAALAAIIDKKPGLVLKWANSLLEEAGLKEEVEVKKL